ncbi:MAG: divergent polysaccharide deacetylase family protein [Candidatus Aminicenantales bacterium]
MKRRRRSPLRWLIPLFAAVLAAIFIFLLVRPGAKSGRKASAAAQEARQEAAAPAASKEKGAEAPAARKAAGGPMAAIIVDDLGYNLEAIENVQAVGRPISVAILPYATLTDESVRLASACGLEILLHLPLESVQGTTGAPVGPGTIIEGMPEGEVREAVEKALARVPGARGVNNHTGSLATEETRVMRPIFEVLKARGLYFVDSRTTSASIAYDEARRMGVRAAVRKVFIDAESGPDRIAEKLQELFRLAKKNGRAVGICHPKRESLAALAMHIGLADTFGVRLVFVSEIVE